MANLAKTMFREYDLRGRVSQDELNEGSVEIIAKAFGTMLRQKNIDLCVVGYDYRSISEAFHLATIKGLNAVGVNVIDIGLTLTPIAYAAQYYFKSKGVAMVTGSHNPNGWSGFKLGNDYSHTLVPEEMDALYQLCLSEKFASGEGKMEKKEYKPIYAQDVLSRVRLEKRMRVVFNAGNGTPAAIVPEILKKAGCEVIGLMTNLDWSFPRYFPNPSLVEMMEDTGKLTKEKGADLGIAMDGDGDRLGITDEKGETIWPDRYLIVLARQMLEKYPGAKIVNEVKCTQALEEDIKNHGGISIMTKTGHSYIKAKVWEEKAILGGEFSGHVFYNKPEYYGFDDAVFASLKLLEYLSGQKKTLSQIMLQTPNYVSSPALQVACADEVKYEVVDKLIKEFKNDGYEVIDINGARVKFSDGWGLVRASSNLPVLVLRFEAKTEKRLAEIMKIFKDKFTNYPQIGKEWQSG
jgi:phosphomannomutase/phosphoglucomutase